MLTLEQQTVVLDDLLEIQVADVYFFKGRLYVVNAWDVPTVEQYISAACPFVQTTTIED